ncbi:MAG: dienelactone hydrolase family protein [Bacteroidota bacterium]
MQKLPKSQIDRRVFSLYDDYAHNRLDRRAFLERLSAFAVGSITVPLLLRSIMPDYENTLQVAPDDDRLRTETITYSSPDGGGDISGLLARPVGEAVRRPAIVVVHENRGLNPHIKDVARRAALEGYLVLAPDALSPLGGYPGNDDDGRSLQRQRDRSEMLEDFIAAYRYLKGHPESTGKVGVVGFCFGGSVSNKMAVRLPELGAAIPFYGGQPKAEDVPAIQAPLLLHFAGRDKRVNEGWPDYARALHEHGKAYSAHLYPDVEHGFHNDSTLRYDFASAQLAWSRTMAFFGRHLK